LIAISVNDSMQSQSSGAMTNTEQRHRMMNGTLLLVNTERLSRSATGIMQSSPLLLTSLAAKLCERDGRANTRAKGVKGSPIHHSLICSVVRDN